MTSDNINWERISDLYPDAELFGSDPGITMHDISQGVLGNCYWIAAASAIAARNKYLLKDIFVKDGKDDGKYAVVLYPIGIPTVIYVDDYIPYNKNGK